MNRLLQRVQGEGDPSSVLADTSTLTSTSIEQAEESDDAPAEDSQTI